MGNINELMGDAIDDLVGDAAKSLMAQAEAMENPAMKDRARQVARSVSAKARDEMISAARGAVFTREAIWMEWLGLTHRERKVLGRIYSFQCTNNKDGSVGEYRMSLANGANELRLDKANLQKILNKLVQLGFVIKRSNGPRTPATYLVDEVVCMTEARRNGYPG